MLSYRSNLDTTAIIFSAPGAGETAQHTQPGNNGYTQPDEMQQVTPTTRQTDLPPVFFRNFYILRTDQDIEVHLPCKTRHFLPVIIAAHPHFYPFLGALIGGIPSVRQSLLRFLGT
jgi:hypothetical protein